MAMYPDRDGVYMMTEPGSYIRGRNTNVVRIIMHQTWTPQSNLQQGPFNQDLWTKETRKAHKDNPNSQFGVSAHFTVEADGRIFQHVDTDDVAKGTSEFAGHSIHI
jgi:N-acetyl-anhydromuramyl-L-alanine amidase AmpD